MHLKRVVSALIGAAALTSLPAFGTVPATAGAHRASHVPAQLSIATLADQLTARLGSEHAGSYLDRAGNLVVNVTSPVAAQQVTAVGAKARFVDHGIRPLTTTKNKLDRLAGTSGTTGLTWGVDVTSNAVIVTVPKNDTDAATNAFIKRARSMSETVQIKRVAGTPRLTLGPGDAILNGSTRCSMSVIGVGGGSEYVVTAGHCTATRGTWTTSSGEVIGTTYSSIFPGSDSGYIRVTNNSLQTDNAQLTEVGRVPVGAQVQVKGAATGTTSGTIRGYDRTVNYKQGVVWNLIAATNCVEPGDSGGSLQKGNIAIGVTSGVSSQYCNSGAFESYYQPLDEALQSQGLTLK